MKKAIILQGTILMLAAGTMFGASNTTLSYDQGSEDKYRANEFSIDAFGTAALGQQSLDHISRQRVNENTRLGVGGGINYFFLRYVGIGADAYTENTGHDFIDNVSGNLILRLPIGQSGLAPYVMGGVGHKFDPIERNFAQAGGGLEFRFTPHFGIFADARFVFIERVSDYGLGRAGVRIAF